MVARNSNVNLNSSRDPYWHAAVRRETIDHPEHAAAIEDECSICHMPMARTRAGALGLEGRVFANLPRSGGGDTLEAQLAADGVSCTVCHQISDERLGTPESFGGGFVMAAPAADGSRSIAGPFEVNDGHTALMRSATGAQPTEAAHIRQSELCATCHMLTTEAFDADGNVVGSLPEQVPYQEWQHSAFVAEEVGCQSCHMPAVGTRRRSRRAKKNDPGWGSSRIRLALSHLVSHPKTFGRAQRVCGCVGFVDAILSSPPYMRQLDYGRDNRLRLWFLGCTDSDVLDESVSPAEDGFLALMTRCFRRWQTTLKPGGNCVLVMGDACSRENRAALPDAVRKLAADAGFVLAGQHTDGVEFGIVSHHPGTSELVLWRWIWLFRKQPLKSIVRILASFSEGMPAHRKLDVHAPFVLHKWPLNFHYRNILEVGSDQVAGLEQAPAELRAVRHDSGRARSPCRAG